jgi:hypothetical protein
VELVASAAVVAPPAAWLTRTVVPIIRSWRKTSLVIPDVSVWPRSVARLVKRT